VPTYQALPRFLKDHADLTPEQRREFKRALERFIADLKAGRGFRRGLRVKGIQGAESIYELTWADDGRATFQYGEAVKEGETHIIWRRVGTHDIFGSP
jgi:hypothetical protein